MMGKASASQAQQDRTSAPSLPGFVSKLPKAEIVRRRLARRAARKAAREAKRSA